MKEKSKKENKKMRNYLSSFARCIAYPSVANPLP